MNRFGILLFILLISGCATNVPQAIREAPPGNPLPAQVRAEPQRFIGQPVRWGGTIAEVRNREDETWVQVVARKLGDDGRPEFDDRSLGRFIARFEGFADPAVFAEGRLLTVAGTVTGTELMEIGEYDYRFPVVAVETYRLWPVERTVYYDPWWHDPFWPYDPWYPHFGYPFYRPYFW